ncbi:hypothetical protein MMPV_009411 [Pyropia vietnamensis]
MSGVVRIAGRRVPRLLLAPWRPSASIGVWMRPTAAVAAAATPAWGRSLGASPPTVAATVTAAALSTSAAATQAQSAVAAATPAGASRVAVPDGTTAPATVAAGAAAAAPAPSVDPAMLRRRNIGISAHIDSGKTTLTERVLFYTGRIRAIHEVRGKDGVGAKMDSMDLEREKGITIQSAATSAVWGDADINIIDTPGHVDFTIEVERALRVLDGAVLVLCAVSGVQSQSLTVDRQMKRYRVPRITFINKLDRAGSDPARVIGQLRTKLHIAAAAVQVPIGLEADLCGVVDVITRQAVYFDGPNGESVRREAVPAEMEAAVEAARSELIETLANVDEELGDLFLAEEPISEDQIVAAIRRATIARTFTPVFLGSALKNTGVQTLLDGVVAYLPHPGDVSNSAVLLDKGGRRGQRSEATDGGATEAAAAAPAVSEQSFELVPDTAAPLVSLAFKLEDGRFGQLTYIRVYQGVLRRGSSVINVRTGKRTKVPRLVQMHSSEMTDIDAAPAGDICAMFGMECASGDTFVDADKGPLVSLESLHVPEPVISLAIIPAKRSDGGTAFAKALARFSREDPTFRVSLDPESNETIISGMGELHLQIYVARMQREYGVDVTVGAPKVNYRETVQQNAPFNYVHKKQSGGSGQFAGVIGDLSPTPSGSKDNVFVNKLVGNNVPPQFVPAIEKGFHEACAEGALTGHPVQGVTFTLRDGKAHSVDSNELAFRMASIMGFRQAYSAAGGTVLEPVMRVEVAAPSEFQGGVMGGLNRRRAVILASTTHGDDVTIEAEVPLASMFGYSTELRSSTQGKGEYSMELLEHRPAPSSEIKVLKEAYEEKKLAGRKQ